MYVSVSLLDFGDDLMCLKRCDLYIGRRHPSVLFFLELFRRTGEQEEQRGSILLLATLCPDFVP